MVDEKIIETFVEKLNLTMNFLADDADKPVLVTVASIKDALELFNRQKAKISDLTYKLMGVMHSVDKWLEGDELKLDEVNRAVTMREKTLQIIEQQKAEIDKLNIAFDVCKKEYDDMFEIAKNQKAEIERLQKEGLQINEIFMDFVNKQKMEAIKEFAELIKKAFPSIAMAVDFMVKEKLGKEDEK